MLLKNIKNQFLNELNTLYTLSESTELFAIFSEKILGFDKFTLRQNLETHSITEKEEDEFSNALSQLKIGRPYQQIIGEAIFYGNTFFVDKNVLIPRPETEELIEIIINQISENKNFPFKILDIGTGSGCIPITLAKIFPNSEITSIDISEKALNIARKNADFHQVNINFIQQDYLNNNLKDSFDIIVSNPPYIDLSEENEIPLSVKNFEPNIALFAPKNKTLAFYEKISQDCQKHLSKNGFLFLEINQKFGEETLNLFKNILSKSNLIKDLSNNHRFIIGKK